MIIQVITLFPEFFPKALNIGMTGRALHQGAITVMTKNPREFTSDRHQTVDDTPYGGGSGMVMRPEPIFKALESITKSHGRGHRILFSPAGTPLVQKKVHELSKKSLLILVCGRYEGVDERVCAHVDEEISIGDFILSGGELAALVLIDALARIQEGVLHNKHSFIEESFEQGLLEYPQYTKPRSFQGQEVPPVLLSGNHEKIRLWRKKQSILRTKNRRPDLFIKRQISDEELSLISNEDDT